MRKENRKKNILDSRFWILDSSSRSGQSIIEVLIAIAIGVILVGGAASLIAPSLKSNTQAVNIQQGTTLATGLMNNVKVFAEANWNNLLSLATGSPNTYFLETAKSPFFATTGTEYIANDGVTSGLIGWWQLNEGYGSTTLDSSGNAVTGTWNGTASGARGTYYGPGRIGQYSGYFDGSDDYVNLGNLGTMPAQGTISFWMNASTLLNYPNPFTTNNGGLNNAIRFEENSSGNFIAVIDGTVYTIIPSGMQTSTWYNVVTTWNVSSSNVTGYLNGGQVFMTNSNMTWPSPFTMPNVTIGQGFSGRYWSGWIDDVRIYNRILSTSEISQIYNDAYRRFFYLSDVYRLSSGTIVTSGGSYDPSSKQVTVSYLWPKGITSTMSTILTRNENFVVDQTDWSGGPGQGGPTTTVSNQFATSSNIDYTTTTGSFYLAIPGY
jgi:hypothetical protein